MEKARPLLRTPGTSRRRWLRALPFVGVLAACVFGVVACEAVLALGDVVSCGDCVGAQCPASCADSADGALADGAGSPSDATFADGGGVDGGGGEGGDGRTPSALFGSIDGGGRALWVKMWGAQSADGVVVDGEGNTYVVGTMEGAVAFDDAGTLQTMGAAADVYLAKIDPSGQTLWARRYGGDAGETAQSIALDRSGYLYIVGDFARGSSLFGAFPLAAPVGSGLSSFVTKISSADGTPVWAFAIGSPGDGQLSCQSVAVGGPSARLSPVVAVTCWFDGDTLVYPDGGSVANQAQTGDAATNSTDGCLLGVEGSSGAVLWANPVGGAGVPDFLYSVAANSSGDFVVAGSVFGNPLSIGISDIAPPQHLGQSAYYGLAAGFSATSGSATWALLYGDPGASIGAAHFEAVATGDAGAVFFGGLAARQADLGTGLMKTVGATDPVCASLGVDGQAPLTEYVQKSGSPGSTNSNNAAVALAVDPAGDLFCAGTLTGPTAFSGTYDLAWPADGGSGAFFAKVGPSGETLWAYGVGSPGAGDLVRPENAAIAPDGTVRVVGAWQGSVTFDVPRQAQAKTSFVLALAP